MKRYSDAARRWSPAGACVVICLLVATVRVPGDEPLTGKPSWRLGRSDCEYLVERHEPIGPVGEDEIRLRAGPGTFLYVRQPVAPARILDDLRLSVRIRADRAGLQLFGRVVVPDAVDPETGEPASVLVPGTMYRAGTQWQELVVDRFPMQLERQLRVLRARLRAPVSARGAFLSEAVINVFGGPGTTQIRLGSAKLIGVVPPAGGGQAIAEPSVRMASLDRPTAGTERREGAWGEFAASDTTGIGFARVIEHQGESFVFLQELGFNVVALPRHPTVDQDREASRLGLRLIAPAPSPVPEAMDRAPSSVAAWICDATGLDRPRQLARFRSLDPLNRPLLHRPAGRDWEASRHFDVLLRWLRPLGGTFPLRSYGPWLRDLTRLARPGTPFWASVQTQWPARSLRQAALLGAGAEDLWPNTGLAESRQMALAALAAGSQGLWFHSSDPLDADTLAAKLRRLHMKRLNLEIQLLGPWVLAGRPIGGIESANPTYQVWALATERSRLLIPTYDPLEVVATDPMLIPSATTRPDRPFPSEPRAVVNRITVAGAPESTRVYELTPLGLRPLSRRRVSGGIQTSMTADQADALLLLTEDPLVVTKINRRVAGLRQATVQTEIEIAELELDRIDRRLSTLVAADPIAVHRIEQARSDLVIARQLRDGEDISEAFRHARSANYHLTRLRAELAKRLTALFEQSSPQEIPDVIRAAPGMWQGPVERARVIDKPPTNAKNLMRTGNCESLDQMLTAGWEQSRRSVSDVYAYLALSAVAPRSGRYSLRLQAQPLTPEAAESVWEMPLLRVDSEPITVYAGDRLLISGYVRIDHPIVGGWHGCRITDSIGGPDLCQRVFQTRGWHRFEMTRVAENDDHLVLTISLTGYGEVFLDDVSVVRLPSRSKP